MPVRRAAMHSLHGPIDGSSPMLNLCLPDRRVRRIRIGDTSGHALFRLHRSPLNA